MKDPSKFGCHYAVVEIDVPQNLSDEAKQKLAEFDQAAQACGAGSGAAGGYSRGGNSEGSGKSGGSGRAA